MSWQQLNIQCKAQVSGLLSEKLDALGAVAISLLDAGEHPIYQIALDDSPLWPLVKVQALFENSLNLCDVIDQLTTKFGSDIITIQKELLTDKDWARLNQANFPPQHFANKLWVIPSWEDPKNFNANKVRIDPGLAFGTGTHETTSLCLKWLAQHPPQDLTVIDYGCGSGILALAALALGAKKVYAIDHDPQAISATKNNAQLNTFVNETNLIVSLPDQLPKIQASLILANILSKPLIQLAAHIQSLCANKGALVLSGLLSNEADWVAAAYANGCQISSIETQGEWARLVLMKHEEN